MPDYQGANTAVASPAPLDGESQYCYGSLCTSVCSPAARPPPPGRPGRRHRSRPTSSVTSNTCGIFKILNRPSFSRVVSLFCKGRSWETTLTPPFTNHEATFSLNTVGDNVGRGEWKLEKRLTSCLTSDEMDLSSSGLESTMTVPMQLMDPRFGIRDLDTMTGAHLDGGREGGREGRARRVGRAGQAGLFIAILV